MSTSVTGSPWQYSRWVVNISRNMHITYPTAGEKTAMITWLKTIWNPVTKTGSRPWLQTKFQEKATAALTDYNCNLDDETDPVLVKLVEIAGRDLKKIPMTDAEKTVTDTLIAATGARRLGTAPYFGSTSGSIVTIPR